VPTSTRLHLFPWQARKVPTHWEFESGSKWNRNATQETEVKIEMNSIPLTLLRFDFGAAVTHLTPNALQTHLRVVDTLKVVEQIANVV